MKALQDFFRDNYIFYSPCMLLLYCFRECAVEEYALWKFLALDLLLNVCVFKGLEP